MCICKYNTLHIHKMIQGSTGKKAGRQVASDDFEKEKEQLLKHFEAGRYMKTLRGDRSLAEVCKSLEVSTNYLSSVERGQPPSDRFISLAAEFYGIDEDSLFILWGKVPILAKEEIRENESLQRTLSEIRRNSKLTDEQKQNLYDSIYKTYRKFINDLEKKGGRRK